jgi:hypothetical protein
VPSGLISPTVDQKMSKRQMLTCSLLAASILATDAWATKTFARLAFTEEPQGSPKDGRAPESKPNDIFRELIPLLLRKTRVPLRLPEYVLDSDDREAPLYAILEVAEPEAYSIQLAFLKDCAGGNACHVGYIGGSRTHPQPSDKPEVPVIVAGGIKGSFLDFDCGVHCDEASLFWSEGEYYYEISLKAGDKKTLIRMANSAILSRHATKKPSS